MATRRLTKSSIDWVKLAERVSETEKPKFLAFRSKSDGYLKRMMSNPENPPKIDWAYYKKTIPVSGLVDNFQKSYDSLKIPFPSDTVTNQIEAQETEIINEIEGFKNSSNQKIKEFRAEADRIKGLLPFGQMTMEDAYDAFPEQRLDPINNPTFWPHNPEDQPNYKGDDEQANKDHH